MVVTDLLPIEMLKGLDVFLDRRNAVLSGQSVFSIAGIESLCRLFD
jgi:hypothetical protein